MHYLDVRKKKSQNEFEEDIGNELLRCKLLDVISNIKVVLSRNIPNINLWNQHVIKRNKLFIKSFQLVSLLGLVQEMTHS